MATEIQQKLKIGDHVRIGPKAWKTWVYNDWQRHKNDVGIVSYINYDGGELPVHVNWNDGESSAFKEEFLIKVSEDWDL